MYKSTCILLIDDNITTTFLNKLVIEKLDIPTHLLTAQDGKAALETLQERLRTGLQLPDLILLDLKMPVMDGFEFFQKYQEQFAGEQTATKVVMLTTSLNSKDSQQAAEVGIQDFITKPLTPLKLKEILNN